MIDWVKASLPLSWAEPICGGHVVRLSPDGGVERVTVISAHVRGSDDAHLTLRTVERGAVEFDGNPSKFLQGHNVVGSDDLAGLVHAAMRKAMLLLGREVGDDDAAAWLAGDFTVARVDVTFSYELETIGDVRAWLRAAGENATMRWRGRGTVIGSTLYFGKAEKGKRGANWTLKAYCKADELNARGRSHRLPEGLACRDELTAWSSNKLRVELMLRTGELKRYEEGRFLRASQWNETTAAEVFGCYFAKMRLGDNVMLPVEVEETLKPALRLAYNAWKTGQDVSAILPRTTFYRYRAKILGDTDGVVDIAVPQPKSNVVPLRRVLTLVPSAVPTFLADRPDLFFRRAA